MEEIKEAGSMMPYNAKSDIHQWAWYQTPRGVKYLCTSAGWVQDAVTNEWNPQNIYLLKFMECIPQPIATDRMINALLTGALVVVKSPVGEVLDDKQVTI